MSIELGNISLLNENQNVTYFEEVKAWFHKSPTTAKTLKIAGFILGGIGLYAIPLFTPGIFSIRGAAIYLGIGAGVVAGVAAPIIVNALDFALKAIFGPLEQ